MPKLKNFLLRSKTMTAVISTIVVLLIISCLYLNSCLNKINYKEKSPGIDMNSNKAGNESNQNSSPPDNEDSMISKDIVNILLIGQDKRPGEEVARSDSMIIATINKKTNSIKLTSLMRDMYVQIPGYDDNKINAAYALGGMDLLTEAVESNFLIKIDGCIEVDFAGFEKIIDEIGGIDIDLNRDEAYYLSRSSGSRFSEGVNRLTGETALTYSRIRYVGNDDYERTERQRNVLVSVFEEIKDSNLKTLLEMADDILPLVTTNLTNTQILNLATKVMLMNVSDIETYRIPADGEFTPDTIKNMSVLVPDLPANRALLKEYIGY
ncbi:MAG TPA: LytR family transcriptional regulator [Clostridiales bacterium]|nr:LytR family transcriptional regulator [Clostridiales bacterium]